MAHSVRTRVGEVFLDANGFVVINYNDIAEVAVQDLEEIEQAVQSLSGEQCVYVIAVPGKHTFITAEARQKMAQCMQKCVLAQALVTKSPLQRAVGNMQQRLRPQDVPLRMFATRERATQWLLQVQRQQQRLTQAVTA